MRFPRVVFSGSCFTPSMHSNALATFPGGGRIGTGFSVVRNASRGSSWREVVATDRRAVEEPPGKPVRQIGSSPWRLLVPRFLVGPPWVSDARPCRLGGTGD